MNLNSILFIESLPTLDLHSFDRETARVAIQDFIKDHVTMKIPFIVIIHGIGSGILKDTTQSVLKQNKQVLSYKIWPYNSGCTIAQLKVDKS